MSDDQFMKMFKYMEDFRKEVNDRFDQTATNDSVDRLAATVVPLKDL